MARDSAAWAAVYNRRTSCERSNKRAKKDFDLAAGHHRSTMMWTIRLYGIAMCQHLDAWHQDRPLDLRSMLSPA